MANADIDIVIQAHDEYTAGFNRFKATAAGATASAAASAASSAQSMDKSWGGALGNMQVAWLKLGAVVAASAWFVAAGQKALEAEVAYNKLRIQVEALGLSYESQRERIEGAINAASKYAIVQDEDVAAVLQQLILHSGNYAGSLSNLNLVYDLAYLKTIAAADAAEIVGKAMSGNTEGLSRLFPELKNVNELLGENATRSEKAAFNLQFLNDKVIGASNAMTQHERDLKLVKAAYETLHQWVGEFVVYSLGSVLRELKSVNNFASNLPSTLSNSFDRATHAINKNIVVTSTATNTYKEGNDAIMESVFSRGKSLAVIAKETKAKSDLKEASEKAAKQAAKEEESASAKIIDIGFATERLLASKEQLIEIEARAFRSQGASTAQVIQYIDALKKKQLAEEEVEAKKGREKDEEESMRIQQKIDLAILKDMTDEEHLFKAELRMQKRNEFLGMEVENQQAFDELSAQSTQARMAIATSAYAAMEDQMLSLVETGHFSVKEFAKIVVQQVKLELIGIAARATVLAIYSAAMAWMSYASGNVVSGAAYTAAAWSFAAAALATGTAAVGLQALAGSSTQGSTAGSSAVAARRESSASGISASGGMMSSSSTRPQEKGSQNITVIINNPLSTDNWDKIVEENIVPAISAAGERNIKISFNAVEAR